MKHIYWKDREEQLCQDWIDADRRNESKIYEDLKPKLNQMSYNILQRYYSVSGSKQKEYVELAVEDCLLELRRSFSHDKKTKFFSYCQTVIKRYFYDTIVLKGNKNNNLNESYLKFEDFEKDNDDFDITSIIPNSDMEYIDYKKPILKRLNELKSKMNTEYALIEKPTYPQQKKRIAMNKYIDGCMKYIERFDIDKIDYVSMNEYVQFNYNLSDWTMNRSSTYFFNIKCIPSQFENKEMWNLKKRGISEDMKFKEEYDYINDDHCPDTDYHVISKRRKIIKENYKKKSS